jgi:hypothetical protein
VCGILGEHDVAAVCAALRPFEWPCFTADMMARCLLGALDSHRARQLIADIPGVSAWHAGELQPADRGDARVEVVVAFLACHRWRSLTLPTVCSQVLDVLGADHVQRAWVHLQLRQLTDEAG